MEDETNTETQFSDGGFYLPAATMTPNFGKIEEVVTNLFDFHGIVLIPESYNK